MEALDGNSLRPKIHFMKSKEVEFKCPKHGIVKTTVFIYEGVEQEPVCPICEKEAEEKQKKEEAERIKIRDREKLYDIYKKSNIESEYWNKTIDDIKPQTPSQNEAVQAVKQMIDKKSGKVVLLGGNGIGKSHLGSMAVKALGGYIYSMYEITTMIRQSYTARAVRTELEIVQDLASVPMLVIDEIGRTRGSDSEMNWLSYILDKRHTRKLPFMLLSNTHLSKNCPKGDLGCDKCFERYVDNDVLSRLRQDTKIITIIAPDARAKKRV